MNFSDFYYKHVYSKKYERYISELVQLIKDYREGELPYVIDEQHVEKWASQFPIWDDKVQRIIFIREIAYVFKQTYFSRKKALKALQYVKKLVTPESYIVNIQKNGASQEEILELMRGKDLLPEQSIYKGESDILYIDDFIFTGSRFLEDIRAWLNEQKKLLPKHLTIRTAAIADHKYARYRLENQRKELGEEFGVDIKLEFYAAETYENRNKYRDHADVLWPTKLPEDPRVEEYITLIKTSQKYPFQFRDARRRNSLFKTERGKQLLEEQFLLAGLHIRSLSANPDPALKPLGFGAFSFGFGSMLVSYRNCPNTTPLALWWGDPSKEKSHPLSRWYPLFPRKTYNH